jgi:hypothetical protein
MDAECDRCGKKVNLKIESNRLAHYESAGCIQAQKNKEKKQMVARDAERGTISHFFARIPSQVARPPSTPALQSEPAPQAPVLEMVHSNRSSTGPLVPFNPSKPQQRARPPAPIDDSAFGIDLAAIARRDGAIDLSSDNADSDSDIAELLPEDKPCKGFVPFPGDPFEAMSQYPFVLHGLKPDNYTWKVVIDGSGITLYSSECTGRVKLGDSCLKCLGIKQNDKFKKIVERQKDLHETTQHAYWNHKQMKDRIDYLNRVNSTRRLQIYHVNAKEVRMKEKMECLQRIINFLGREDVPRLKQTLSVALRSGISPDLVLGRLIDAAKGFYRARGYDEKDYDSLVFVACTLLTTCAFSTLKQNWRASMTNT